jgi:hypothetical protein
MELRNILKATSGFMLVYYAQNGPKIVAPAVKILSSAGKELQACESAFLISLSCNSCAIKLWSEMSTVVMQQLLSPMEFQDMKILVFQVHILIVV